VPAVGAGPWAAEVQAVSKSINKIAMQSSFFMVSHPFPG
jgi:hypothetical protein